MKFMKAFEARVTLSGVLYEEDFKILVRVYARDFKSAERKITKWCSSPRKIGYPINSVDAIAFKSLNMTVWPVILKSLDRTRVQIALLTKRDWEFHHRHSS